MTEKNETKMLVFVAVAIIGIIFCSLFVGCKTTKTIVETQVVTIHDTLTSYRTDTIRDVQVRLVRDTVRLSETHTYTLAPTGDTIREIHHYTDREKVIVVDSTDRYKATVDSLRAALKESKDKQTVITKTKKVVRWWEWVVFLGIIGVILYFVLKRGGRTFIDRV